jgi:hypothetical protein
MTWTRQPSRQGMALFSVRMDFGEAQVIIDCQFELSSVQCHFLDRKLHQVWGDTRDMTVLIYCQLPWFRQ